MAKRSSFRKQRESVQLSIIFCVKLVFHAESFIQRAGLERLGRDPYLCRILSRREAVRLQSDHRFGRRAAQLDPFSSSRRMGFPNLCLEWGLFFFLGGAAQQFYMTRGVLPLAAAPAGRQVGARAGDLDRGRVRSARHSILDRAAFLGNASYSSYLIHFPLQLMIVIFMDAAGIDREWMMSTPALLAFLALVIGCSLVV